MRPFSSTGASPDEVVKWLGYDPALSATNLTRPPAFVLAGAVLIPDHKTVMVRVALVLHQYTRAHKSMNTSLLAFAAVCMC